MFKADKNLSRAMKGAIHSLKKKSYDGMFLQFPFEYLEKSGAQNKGC